MLITKICCTPQNSFQKWVAVNSPKATVSFLPKESWYVPLISLSFGQAFFTEDPRIGTGSAAGTPVATSHSYQVVASKTIHKTDLRLTLGHVTSSAQLAKIDPDTGLQFNQGPSRLRFMTVTVRRNFSQGSLLATFSKADARDLDTRRAHAGSSADDSSICWERFRSFRFVCKREENSNTWVRSPWARDACRT